LDQTEGIEDSAFSSYGRSREREITALSQRSKTFLDESKGDFQGAGPRMGKGKTAQKSKRGPTSIILAENSKLVRQRAFKRRRGARRER